MPAVLIELDCPTCSSELELDRGFAGGVCRCSTCGTLMLVPSDPAHERPERLVRPRRPGEPAVANAGGNGEVGKTRPTRPKVSEKTLASETATSTEAGTYVTESGRTVEIDRHTRIATAHGRRQGVRITTMVIFGLIVAAILGAGVWAMVIMLSAPEVEPIPQRDMVTTFPYDQDANPYTLDKPNMLGLPIGAKTLIVIDASEASKGWLDDVTDAAARGLSRSGSGAEARLLYATQGEATDATGGYVTVGYIDAGDVRSAGGKVKPTGTAKLEDALAAVAEDEASNVILVTGQNFKNPQAAKLAAALKAAPNAIVDIVAIDHWPPALNDLARDHHGRFVKLQSSTLKTWRAEAK